MTDRGHQPGLSVWQPHRLSQFPAIGTMIVERMSSNIIKLGKDGQHQPHDKMFSLRVSPTKVKRRDLPGQPDRVLDA